jgi:O-antigen biosynthesis protein WbqP
MTVAPPRSAYFIKRLLDVGASLVGLALLWPVFLLVAMAIKLDSPGPIIFRQTRIGRRQIQFQILKFRTMRTDTPDLPTDQMQKLPSPITRVGRLLRRTSLDELPQFINVVRGEMSLVGPRPALYNQDDLIAAREAEGVHSIPPGITGWAQINGRDELAVPEKVRLDAWYLEHFSLWLDVRILARTITAVFSKRGVY